MGFNSVFKGLKERRISRTFYSCLVVWTQVIDKEWLTSGWGCYRPT